MLLVPRAVRILLAAQPVDMRNSIDGLAAIILNEWHEDVYAGELFVFVSRRGDRTKVLTRDNGGFVLFYKRLEQGRFLPGLSRPRARSAAAEQRARDALDGIELSRVRWPKPRVRPMRFHDLRHTTAVQRILRHRDPRMTANVYGHLSSDYLRAEIDRLRFNSETAFADRETDRGVPLMSPTPERGPHARQVPPRNMPAAFIVSEATPAGLEPATPGFEGRCSIQMSYGARLQIH